MQIDWTHFSPGAALIGGAEIGLAAGLMILLLGRIAGVSGILAGIIPFRREETGWRLAFALGLVAAPLFAGLFRAPAPPEFTAGYPLLALAGLLVGFGARLGGGCTSGHGVCGLSRFSLRSLVATVTFMSVAIATVFVLRHVIG